MKTIPALLLLGLAVSAAPAAARSDFWFSPSLKLAEIHDDNVFLATTQEQADTFTRVTPGLALGHDADSLSLRADYNQDAEYYDVYHQLDSDAARRDAELTAQWRANQRTNIDFSGSYLATPTPGELNAITGLEPGRIRATRHFAGSTLHYELTPTDNASLEYRYTRDSAAGGISGDTDETLAGYTRELSATSTLRLGYAYRLYHFDNGAGQYSNTATAGWLYHIDRSTTLDIQGGPRFFADSVKPDFAVSLNHEFTDSKLSINYIRSESVLAGVAGKVENEVTTAIFTQQMGKNLQFSVTPAFGTVSGTDSSAQIRRIGIDAGYQFNNVLSFNASWQYNRQHIDLYGGPLQRILQNVFMLEFKLVYPARQEQR